MAHIGSARHVAGHKAQLQPPLPPLLQLQRNNRQKSTAHAQQQQQQHSCGRCKWLLRNQQSCAVVVLFSLARLVHFATGWRAAKRKGGRPMKGAK